MSMSGNSAAPFARQHFTRRALSARRSWSGAAWSIAILALAGGCTGDALLSGPASMAARSAGGGASIGACARLVSDTEPRSAPALDMPGYLQSATDPAFGTKITRVTGDPGETIPVVGGTWQEIAGPEYAKDPAWNADQSMMVLKRGASDWLIVDGNDYHVLYLTGAFWGTEFRWHPTLPDIMVYSTDGGGVGHWNVRQDSQAMKYEEPGGFHGGGFGPWEGNLSNDGNYVVVDAFDSDEQIMFWAVNISTGERVSPIIAAADLGLDSIDWVSISPLGRYIVVSRDSHDQRVLDVHGGETVASWEHMGHYDLGVDADGNEVAFNAEGVMRRLSDGSPTELVSTGTTDYHSSTRNVSALGWGYGSLMGSGPLDGEIVAEELKPGGGIRRLVHHRSSGASAGGYDHSVFATASPDGLRVLYRSDWGDSSSPVYGFVADVTDLCR